MLCTAGMSVLLLHGHLSRSAALAQRTSVRVVPLSEPLA